MKLITVVALLFFSPSLSYAAPGHLAGIVWSFQKSPTDGLDDVTFPFNIAKSPHRRGFYYSQQFAIKGIKSLSYTGVQPQPNDAKGNSIVHGVFSTFQKGSNSSHPNCHTGADGGPGVSCAVEIIGNYDHTYNLEVKRIQGTTWRGTLIDSVTTTRTLIGEWTLPKEALKIANGYTGFLEYFPWNGQKPVCANLPFTEASYYNPTSNTVGASGGSVYHVTDAGGNSGCANHIGFATAQVEGGYSIRVGF